MIRVSLSESASNDEAENVAKPESAKHVADKPRRRRRPHAETTKHAATSTRKRRPAGVAQHAATKSEASNGAALAGSEGVAEEDPTQHVAGDPEKYRGIGLCVDQVLISIAEKNGSIHEVIRQFWDKHKTGDLAVKEQLKRFGECRWKLLQVEDHECDRPNTSNWTKSWTSGRIDFQMGHEALVSENITGKMKSHAGEVRVWPGENIDTWIPAKRHAPALMELLNSSAHHPQMAVQSTQRERALERCKKVGGSDGVAMDCFSPVFESRDCTPNLESALSTVAVFDRNGQDVCMRQVRGVTLGEVFSALGERHTYTELYKKFISGRVIINTRIAK